MSEPTRGAAEGMRSATNAVTAIGKIIFSFFDTGRRVSILIRLSSFVVRSFIIGGWMTGTSAMYEYAATAIGPSSSGFRSDVT